MKKYRYLLFSTSISLCFFGVAFTLIRIFYYGATVTLNEYIFPILIGCAFGIGFGIWHIQTKDYNEKLKNLMEDLEVFNNQLKKKNEKLNSTNKELAETQKQLHRSQKMEIIGTVAGGVAHDLNNILCGLVSYPDLLLMDIEEDSPFRSSILKMKKSGEKAAAIVQDLLSLARRNTSTKEPIKLNEIIREYLNSPEFDSLKKFHPGLEISIDFDPDIWNIMGSSVHLSKTIMNLVSNAAEAKQNGGKIVISTKNLHVENPIKAYSDMIEDGNYAVLEIKDFGIGISNEDLEKIFEPFYSKKTMGRSGTGLGMAVVWGTVMDHKAYIDVKSVKGEGTSFALYFPATTKQLSRDKKFLPDEGYIGKGESILVVDDLEEQRKLASEILKGLGYTVNVASSGEEAIDYLKRNSTDLIILDMIMEPGMDGLETYQKVLALHPRQKAIILSGFSETDRVKEVLRLGASKYVSKPYTIKKIAEAVRISLSDSTKPLPSIP